MVGLACFLPSCAVEPPPPVPLFSLEVAAGPYDRVDSLVRVPLDQAAVPVHVLETTQGRSIPTPSQYDPARRELVWIVTGELSRDEMRSYAVVAGEDPALRAGGEVRDPDGRGLELYVRGERVLRFNCAEVPPPDPAMPASLTRSAYIHPLWTPSGKVVTDDFHPDHAHQRGIWMTWTETRFQGRTPDFWNLFEGSGELRFAGIDAVHEGPVFAGLDLRLEHVDLLAPGGVLPILDDRLRIRVYMLGGKRGGFFLLDVDSTQRNVTDSLLELPEYHYGGFAVRAARTWEPEVLTVRTASGKDRPGADGSREDWIMMSGPLGDAVPAGLVVFGHPGNPRAPQPLRMHPEMPYFAFSPQRLGAWGMEPGQPVEFRYRILVFDGSPPVELVEAYWRDYAEPPTVTTGVP